MCDNKMEINSCKSESCSLDFNSPNILLKVISNDDFLLRLSVKDNYPIVEKVEPGRTDNEAIGMTDIDEAYEMQRMTDKTFVKYPIQLPIKSKCDVTTNYIIQDGKLRELWKCEICAKEFLRDSKTRHMSIHTDEKKFQCETCGKVFRRFATLSKHQTIHLKKRSYICAICQMTFKDSSTLATHGKTHTKVKLYCCHVCNKAFRWKGNLTMHIHTHSNERPYKCDVCPKGFNQMNNLMIHKLKAHQSVSKPPIISSICGVDLQKRCLVKIHQQNVHGASTNSKETTSDRYTDDETIPTE